MTPPHEDAHGTAPNAKAMIEHMFALWWMLLSPSWSISSTTQAKSCWSLRSPLRTWGKVMGAKARL